MELKANNTKTMIVLVLLDGSQCGTVLRESDDLDIFGMIFDSKMTFEKHLGSVARAAV